MCEHNFNTCESDFGEYSNKYIYIYSSTEHHFSLLQRINKTTFFSQHFSHICSLLQLLQTKPSHKFLNYKMDFTLSIQVLLPFSITSLPYDYFQSKFTKI